MKTIVTRDALDPDILHIYTQTEPMRPRDAKTEYAATMTVGALCEMFGTDEEATYFIERLNEDKAVQIAVKIIEKEG